jgi:hypothetical protein
MPLKGLNTGAQQDPLQRSAFRTSWTQPEGGTPAHILEGVIVDINLVNWTVDFASKYDQRSYLNVQISSPYMHYNNGEGFYVMPDIGAKCYLCLPSDGPPPFILGFIMPMEAVPQAGTDDAPEGTVSDKGGVTQAAGDASFAGGRFRAKPGDMVLRSRDGSFVVLHKGGVLQIGSSELAQRIYIPLMNLITDISQNYRHHNAGGSMNWFVNSGESEENPSTVWRHTFRLLANDEKATVRVAFGKLSDVVVETDSEILSDLSQLGIGTTDPTVCEVVIAPDGFDADSGDRQSDVTKKTVLRYFVDKAGGVMLRATGSLYCRVDKKLRVRVRDDIELLGKKDLRVEVEGIGRIQAGASLDVSAGVLRLNGGSKPVAHVGSQLKIVTIAPIPITVVVGGVPSPGVIAIGAVFTGMVVTGNPTILV